MKPLNVAFTTLILLSQAVTTDIPAFSGDNPEHMSREAASNGSWPSSESLKTVASWLSVEFGLSIPTLPQVEFVTKKRMSALRHRGVPSDHSNEGRDIVAIYDDDARTIYLPRGWSGQTPAETSIFVHEMVHHAQNLAGMKAECPQAREKMAYEAQERWLKRFGTDMEKEFGMDGFTLLVLSNCGL